MAESTGPGRPRLYCRRSHRQRHYEARRIGKAMGLDPDLVVVDVASFRRLADRLYILESAVKDVERDLRQSRTGDDYRAAFRHLYAAAVDLVGEELEPRALT